MSKKQKILIWLNLGVFTLTLVAAPWVVSTPARTMASPIPGPAFSYTTSGTSYSINAPIWDGPLFGELNVAALLLEWLAIVVISGVMFFMLKTKKQPPVTEFKNN